MHKSTLGLVTLGFITLGVACALPSADEKTGATSSAYSDYPTSTGSTTSPPPYPVPTASSGFCSPPPQGTTTTTDGAFTVTTMISGYLKTVTRSRSLAEGPVFTYTPATTEPPVNDAIRRCYVKNEHENKTEHFSWQCPQGTWRLDGSMEIKSHGYFERRLMGRQELVNHWSKGEQNTPSGGMLMNDERLLELRDGRFLSLGRHRYERYGDATAAARERLLSFDGTTCTYKEDGRLELCHVNGIPMAESWESAHFPSVADDERCSRAAIESRCCETCTRGVDFTAGLGSCTLLASRDVPALID